MFESSSWPAIASYRNLEQLDANQDRIVTVNSEFKGQGDRLSIP